MIWFILAESLTPPPNRVVSDAHGQQEVNGTSPLLSGRLSRSCLCLASAPLLCLIYVAIVHATWDVFMSICLSTCEPASSMWEIRRMGIVISFSFERGGMKRV
jgi:hypothetical protein